MAAELIVIPREGEKSEKYSRVNSPDSHNETLEKYILDNNINIEINRHPYVYALGKKMALLNYVIIATYNKEFCVYLPAELSQMQAEWFNNRKDDIYNREVLVVSIDKKSDNEYQVTHAEGYINGNSPADVLFRKIKEKSYNYENEEVKKHGNR